LEATYATCNCFQQFGQLCAICFGNNSNYRTDKHINQDLKKYRSSAEAYKRGKGKGSRSGQKDEENNVGGEEGYTPIHVQSLSDYPDEATYGGEGGSYYSNQEEYEEESD